MSGRNPLLGRALAAVIFGLVVALAGPAAAANAPVMHKVGAVTWHARKFVGQELVLTGYLLVREKDYILFSDEPSGKVSSHDLPVTGPGLDQMQPLKKYVIAGRFLDHGLAASNGSRYHLELTAPPEEAKP
jgi:hypothetical protein